MLTAYLRRQAETVLVREQLVTAARRWLHDHAFLIPTDRSLEQIAARAQEYARGELKNAIEASAGSDTVAGWTVKLGAVGPNPDQALLDWLRASPKGFGTRAIGDVQKRIAVLHALGAECLILPEVPIERIRQHAIRISRRKASTLPRLNPRRHPQAFTALGTPQTQHVASPSAFKANCYTVTDLRNKATWIATHTSPHGTHSKET